MRIDIAEVMSKPDEKREFSFPLELKNIDFMGEEYSVDSSDDVQVVIVNVGNRSVGIKLSAKLQINFACSRCLTEVKKEFEVEFDDIIKVDGEGKGFLQEDDCTSYIDEFKLDTDLLISDEMYMLMPGQVLCDEGCKGICSVCGANLNLTECTCDRQVLDPRMAKIRDIFNNFKEV